MTTLAAGSFLKCSNGSVLAFLSRWAWINCFATTSVPGVLSHLHNTRDFRLHGVKQIAVSG